MGAVKEMLLDMASTVMKELNMDDQRFDEIREWILDNCNLNTTDEELVEKARKHFD